MRLMTFNNREFGVYIKNQREVLYKKKHYKKMLYRWNNRFV